MNIYESKKYKKAYSKLIKNTKERDRIENIKSLLISKDNLQCVINDPLHNIYHIEQLKYNNHNYSARVNNKVRLIMIPVGDYPYNIIEITDIVFDDIDNYHYERG